MCHSVPQPNNLKDMNSNCFLDLTRYLCLGNGWEVEWMLPWSPKEVSFLSSLGFAKTCWHAFVKGRIAVVNAGA